MNEPRRLMDPLHEADAEAVMLLRSACEDEPGDADREAVAAMLGLAATGATALGGAAHHAISAPTGAAPLAPAVPAGALAVKVAAALALAFALGAASGVRFERRRAAARIDEGRAASSAPVPREPATIAHEAAATAPMIAPAEVPATTSAPVVETTPREPPRAGAAQVPSRRAGMGGATGVSADGLERETAILAHAKRAIAARDFREASAALDLYERVAPRGALLQEARVLRVQLAADQGARAAALDHGRAFLEAFPDSPYARRVRALVEALEGPPPREHP